MQVKDFEFRIWDGKEYIKNVYEFLWVAKNSVIDNNIKNSNIVELYTGVSDKNGKKIFEGDKIKYIYFFKHALLNQEKINKINAKISEKEGFVMGSELGYKVYNLENQCLCFLRDCREIEVVGNIHQNVEE